MRMEPFLQPFVILQNRKDNSTMKRIISLLLAVCLLCTPVSAMDRTEFEDVLDKLRDSKVFSQLFDSEELKQNTQKILQRMRDFTDEIKSMSDEELEQKIRDVAAEYNIPEMNDEQIRFLMDLCRSFETAEKFGNTIKSYEQKIHSIGDTLEKLSDNLGKLLDKVNQLLDFFNGLLDRFTGSAEAEPINA